MSGCTHKLGGVLGWVGTKARAMIANRRGTGVVPRRPGFGTAFLPSCAASRLPVQGMRGLCIDIGMPAGKRGPSGGMARLMKAGKFARAGADGESGEGKGVVGERSDARRYRRVVESESESGSESESESEDKEEGERPNANSDEGGTEKASSSDEDSAERPNANSDEGGTEKASSSDEDSAQMTDADEESGGEDEGEGEGEDEGNKTKKRARSPMKLEQFEGDEGAQAIIAKYRALQKEVMEAEPQAKTESAAPDVDPDSPLGKAMAELAAAEKAYAPVKKAKDEAAKKVTAAQKGGEGYPQLRAMVNAQKAVEKARAELDAEQAKEKPDKEALDTLLETVARADLLVEATTKAWETVKKQTRAESKRLGDKLKLLKPAFDQAQSDVTRLKGDAPKATKSKATGKKEQNDRVRALRYKMEDELRAYRDGKKQAQRGEAEEQRQTEQRKKAKETECYELACHIHLLREEFLNFYEEKCTVVEELLAVHGNCEGPEEEQWSIPPEDVAWFRELVEYIKSCEKNLRTMIDEDQAAWRVERHKEMVEEICDGYVEQDGKQSWETLRDEPLSDEEEEVHGELGDLIDDGDVEYADKRTKLTEHSRYDSSYMNAPKGDTELDKERRRQADGAVKTGKLAEQLRKDMEGQLQKGGLLGGAPKPSSAAPTVLVARPKKPKPSSR